MKLKRAVVLAAALSCWTSPAIAQVDGLAAACSAAGTVAEMCRLGAQAVEVTLPRLGLAAAGGNPVPGTASTLGVRVAGVPRGTVAVRATAAGGRMPPIRRVGVLTEDGYRLASLNLDGGLGVFPGLSLLPTVGGVGSLDLLASAGMFVTRSGAKLDRRPLTAGAGLRLGLLRESFYFPGVSLTGTYRRIGRVTVGDPEDPSRNAFFTLTGTSALGLRGAVSKRIVLVGVTAGVGRERYRSDVRLGVREPQLGMGETSNFSFSNFTVRRTNFFVNASWTTLILHLVAELGWQEGGDRVTGPLPPLVQVSPTRGSLFGSLAARLSI
jgi:hypothetical protein